MSCARCIAGGPALAPMERELERTGTNGTALDRRAYMIGAALEASWDRTSPIGSARGKASAITV